MEAKAKVDVKNFEELKELFLLDVKTVIEMDEIPLAIVINWDHTAINYVPVSSWTIEKEGSLYELSKSGTVQNLGKKPCKWKASGKSTVKAITELRSVNHSSGAPASLQSARPPVCTVNVESIAAITTSTP